MFGLRQDCLRCQEPGPEGLQPAGADSVTGRSDCTGKETRRPSLRVSSMGPRLQPVRLGSTPAADAIAGAGRRRQQTRTTMNRPQKAPAGSDW